MRRACGRCRQRWRPSPWPPPSRARAVTDPASRWNVTGSLGRALTVGGVGVALALAAGRPAVIALVAPLLVAGAMGVLHRPTREPRAFALFGHRQLHEAQGTRARLETGDLDDAEHVTRVMAPAPYVAFHPVEGVIGHLIGSEGVRPIDVSPRRWGQRIVGAEKVAFTTPWAGYRWGPVPVPGREIFV